MKGTGTHTTKAVRTKIEYTASIFDLFFKAKIIKIGAGITMSTKSLFHYIQMSHGLHMYVPH